MWAILIDSPRLAIVCECKQSLKLIWSWAPRRPSAVCTHYCNPLLEYQMKWWSGCCQILTQFWRPLKGLVTPQLRPAQTKNLAQTPARNQFKVSRKLIPLKKTSVGQNDKIMQSQEESRMRPFPMFPLPKTVDHRWSRSWKNLKNASFTPRIVHVSPWKCVYRNICFAEVIIIERIFQEPWIRSMNTKA